MKSLIELESMQDQLKITFREIDRVISNAANVIQRFPDSELSNKPQTIINLGEAIKKELNGRYLELEKRKQCHDDKF